MSSGFFRRDKSRFRKGKRTQIDTENDRNPKFSKFQCFHLFLVEISTDSANWNPLKGQTGKNGCPVGFHEEVIPNF